MNEEEEYSKNNDSLDEEAIGDLEDITKQPDKVNDKIEEYTDAGEITTESSSNNENIYA